MATTSCGGTPPSSAESGGARFAPCPASPNCVSSEARDSDHYVEPFRIARDGTSAWQAARQAVKTLPRTRIVDEDDGYVRAECRSRLFGFVDDLELKLVEGEGIIAVRSSSRVGYSDFGVNRRRVERLREELFRLGAVE